jgi:membrane protease YdiL (CAAX protease family)
VSGAVAACRLEPAPAARARPTWRTAGAAGAYVAAIAAAEVLAASVDVVAAAALDAALLVALVTHYVLSPEDTTSAATATHARTFAALAIVPLVRLSIMATAPGDPLLGHAVSPDARLAVGGDLAGLLPTEATGVALVTATVLAARVLGLPGVLPVPELRRPAQWGFAAGAVVLAAAGTAVLGLGPATDAHGAEQVAVVALVVFLAGAIEELVFRGIVQDALEDVFGAWAVVLANALFTATYLGAGSARYVVFMCTFGALCGWWAHRTRSIAGVAIAHGILAVGLLVLGPLVA